MTPDRPIPTPSSPSTPSLIDLVRELRDVLGMPNSALPITPKQAWEEALRRVGDLAEGVCGACVRGDSEVKMIAETATEVGRRLGRKEAADQVLAVFGEEVLQRLTGGAE